MDTIQGMVTRQWEYNRGRNSWYASLSQLVQGLSVEHAIWRSPQGGHTIYELVQHIRYATEYMASRLRGDSASWDPQRSFAEGATGVTEGDWYALLSSCADARQMYEQALGALTEEALHATQDVQGGWDPFTFADYAMQLTLHDAYHIGQIALLRSMQSLPPVM